MTRHRVELVTCPVCGGAGVVIHADGWVEDCESCDGTGWVNQ